MSERSLGFYLHTSWEYNYPFAVRSWKHADFRNFFTLLKALGFNRVMFWPLSETMPPPLSDDDRRELATVCDYVDDAHELGLEFWVTFCPNTTTRSEIAEKPFKKRHFYPYKVENRLDDPVVKEAYFKHRAEIFSVLNNADAYVSIDGDPGGYAGAEPAAFLEVFQHDREVLNRVGTHPTTQKVVPWLWAGWGSDWEKNGTWQEPIEPLTEPVLQLLKEHWAELQPCELLPGRSIVKGWANGRTNFEIAEKADMISRSTLLTYEIIEYEPTPPAVVIQFDQIRHVFRQETDLIARSRGLMGNAQQPLMALPNLFFYAKTAQDSTYLERSDIEVLHELAAFLGGDETILAPAWEALRLDLTTLPADLPGRLRAASLKSENAKNLPGGPELYLEILASFVEVRLTTLKAAGLTDGEAAIFQGIEALVKWWKIGGYVYTGLKGTDFRPEFIHPGVLAPVEQSLQTHASYKATVLERLVTENVLTQAEARNF